MTDQQKQCPSCGEPVAEGWKVCPACEASLSGLTCYGCGRPVKENWKRCPECEARLLCRTCGGRLSTADGKCPVCTGQAEETAAGDPDARWTDPATGMEFIYVPGGEFLMGDTFGEGIESEQPVHGVRLSGFYMARTCVTQFQWDRLMAENPSRFPGKNQPVENVTLYQVQDFVDRLAAASNGRQLALPTEAQWEYAARSGGKEELYAGGDSIDAVAWYAENSDAKPHPVAERAPNGLGLYDMSGNVWEWCRDAYRKDAYEFHSEREPVVEDRDAERVIRGGSWNLDAWSARCARRFSFRPGDKGPGLGFRLVLAVPKG
jgi:formylglycine-generating enzyme required for sulfatase activity